MKIVCSSILKQKESMSDALKHIAQLGFRYVDIVSVNDWIHFNPRDLAADYDGTLAAIERELKENNLTLTGVNFKVSPEIYDQSEEAKRVRADETSAFMRMLRHFGASTCSVVPCCWVAPEEWEAKIGDCARSMAEEVEIAAAEGVSLNIELHVNSPVEKVEQAARLLDETPGLTVAFDPSHFYMQGYTFDDISWILDKTGYVHMRDADMDKMQVPFGTGRVEFNLILGYLKRSGYEGDFAVEFMQETDGHDYDEDALKMRDKILEFFPDAEY